MAQSITIKIADKTFPLKAENPETERRLRLAAERINEMLAKYNERYPNTGLADKLAFVALNETVAKIGLQELFQSQQAEVSDYEKEITKYLSTIEK